MAAPALPWARPEGSEQDPQEDRPDAEQRKDLSLKAGDRIKVLWEIESEAGETTTKWWGARVQNDANAENARATLRYDAHGEFEEETAEVTFLSTDMLKDMGSKTELYWGRESEIDEEENDDMAEEVDLRELCAQPGAERDVGDMEREAMAQLQHLPMDHQVRLAEGFRSFVDHMSGHIKARAEASGSQTYVVTESDIHDIVGGFVKPK